MSLGKSSLDGFVGAVVESDVRQHVFVDRKSDLRWKLEEVAFGGFAGSRHFCLATVSELLLGSDLGLAHLMEVECTLGPFLCTSNE